MLETPSPWTNLLLFDGICHLCQHTVQLVLAHDKKGVIHFCSIQSELGSRLYREHGLNPEQPHSLLLLTPNGAFIESDAGLEVARLLGGWRRLLLMFKIVPKGLRDAVYRWVSRNRYRWFGRDVQCWLPRPEWKGRFHS